MKKQLPFLLTAIAIWLSHAVYAQQPAPGGVQGAKAWFMTEPLSPGHNYSRWVDKSGHGLELKQGANTEFRWDDKEHNFHKSLLFYRDDVYFDLPGSSGRQLTTFGLFNPYQYNNEQPSEYLLYDVVSTGNNESFNMATDKLYTPTGKIHLDYGAEQGSDLWFRRDSFNVNNYLKYQTSKILSHYKAVTPVNTVWGEAESLRIHINKNRSGMSKIWYFIPEFIVYDRLLTPLERLRVESYMGRKYAIALERSYLSPTGNLMWDYAVNSDYNNRLFYVGREDASGLFQSRAVSSYEQYLFNNTEGLEGAAESGYNSTSDNRHWNNRDRNRLLVFGVQQLDSASYTTNGHYAGLSDDSYYMLGDDDGTLPIAESDTSGLAGISLTGRTWKMQTNVTPTPRPLPSWRGDTLLKATNKYNHQQLSIQASSSKSEQRLFTDGTANYGAPAVSFELATAGREHQGEIQVGFTTTNSAEANVYYGFIIREDGNVYTIEKGQQRLHIDGYITIRHRKFTVALEGSELVFYYQYHHAATNVPYSRRISLKAEDRETLKYGIIHYKGNGKGDGQLFSRLETEGFVQNTGARTRLELRGVYNQINNINYNGMQGLPNINPTDNKTVWLIVDPTGQGNFTGDNVAFYKADERTTYGKGRYLFDDVNWDDDGSGSDVFTFGYSNGTIVAQLEETARECDGLGNITTESSLKVLLQQGDSIKHGLSIYNSGDTVVYADSIALKQSINIKLASGTYRVAINNPATREEVSEQVSITDNCELSEQAKADDTDDNTEKSASSDAQLSIKAYPNPISTGQELTIETRLAEKSPVIYLVYDLTGRLVDRFERPQETDFHSINYRFTSQGIYIVKVISNTGEKNQKINVK